MRYHLFHNLMWLLCSSSKRLSKNCLYGITWPPVYHIQLRKIEAKCLGYFNHLSNTLVVRLYRTGNFLQNILGCYSSTTQDSEINDTSFESPIIGRSEFAKKLGVAWFWGWPCPLNWKSTTFTRTRLEPFMTEILPVSVLLSNGTL